MRWLFSWFLFLCGALFSWLANHRLGPGRWFEWPYACYSFFMIHSEAVQGPGEKGPWDAP